MPGVTGWENVALLLTGDLRSFSLELSAVGSPLPSALGAWWDEAPNDGRALALSKVVVMAVWGQGGVRG